MKIIAEDTQIKSYFIHSCIKQKEEVSLYSAEDFLTDKRVLLYHFSEKKRDIFTALQKLSDVKINKIFKQFAYEKEFFAVSKVIDSQTLSEYLCKNTPSEKELNALAKDFLDILISLKEQGVFIDTLESDTLFILDDGTLFLGDFTPVERLEDEFSVVAVFGEFLYLLITKKAYSKGKKASSEIYSKSFVTFVNNILDNKEKKSFTKIEKLLPFFQTTKEKHCEPLVCQERKRGFSSFFRITSALLIASFLAYILLFSQEVKDIKNLNIIDASRYYVAAHLNNAQAEYALAEMYEYGVYVDRDMPKALHFYELSAKHGNNAAKKYLAYLYLNDERSVPKDIQKAIYWYKEAAKDGDRDAFYSLGYIYAGDEELKDIDRAIYWYEKAAKQGYKKVYYSLGLLYLQRKKTKEDYKKAFEYFSRQKEHDSYSQMALGYMYAKGLGVHRDRQKAIEYYEKSAKQGHEIAALNLANMYAYAKDEALRDKTLAKYWYEAAAKKGNKVAKKELKNLERLFRRYDKVKRKQKKSFQAVRYGHLIDRGEYIEDTDTGLLWQKDGHASGRLNFYQAQDYASNLKLGGKKGWRVPTAQELDTIFPAIKKPFINTAYTDKPCCQKEHIWSNYWTSEMDNSRGDYAYIYQWYEDGSINNCYASKNYAYVRCVHD
jgi:TPR repeat protein